jgi:integration host factor subunit beta
MTKSQLIQALARAESLTVRQAESIVNMVFDTITGALVAGERVEIRDFGTFKIKEYDDYQGRNPKTGLAIKVERKKLPVFKVGRQLKTIVDK